jgi:hypothetical protein
MVRIMVRTALQQYLVAISITLGTVFILSIVECNKKKGVCYCFYWDPALLLQKSYCGKSSVWPRVELRFCPWLSVPKICKCWPMNERALSCDLLHSATFVVNVCYTRKNETAQRGRPKIRLWSKFCALTYNDDRSLLSYRLSADCVHMWLNL